MKRLTFLMLMLASTMVFAQKQAKPNINKAIKSWQDGKFDEAKTMIDAATTYEKTMNDGKTWYYRGVIYASLDTTTNEKFKSLEAEPFKVAMESFAKAQELSKNGKEEYFVTGPDGITPIIRSQHMEALANYYLDKGIKKYSDEQNNEESLANLEKSKQLATSHMDKYANDTTLYYVAGLVAHQAEMTDAAIENTNLYLEKGGKSRDAYLILYQIYLQGEKEDKEKALQVVRQARAALPSDPMFPKAEIELLINLNRQEEAKKGLQEAVAKEPNDKLLHFFLGYIESQLGNVDAARTSFQNALKVDPEYFEAQYHLANTYLVEVDKISKDLSATGNTAADSKKRSGLIQKRVAASELAIPYLEKAEKMKAPDSDTEIELMQKLSLLYYYIADDKNSARVEKKLKQLGVED